MTPLKPMRMVAPELQAHVVPIAEEQTEFMTVYGALVRHPAYAAPAGWNSVLLAFRPDEEQRKAIAEGADVYVGLLTFGGPMQPILGLVGKESASAIYNVPVAPAGGAGATGRRGPVMAEEILGVLNAAIDAGFVVGFDSGVMASQRGQVKALRTAIRRPMPEAMPIAGDVRANIIQRITAPELRSEVSDG